MESVGSYLRTAGRWRWLLVVVPLLSALGSAALIASQPASFAATALVSVDPPTDASTQQSLGVFSGAVGLASTRDAVAGSVGVAPSSLRGALSATPRSTQSGPTGLVDVRYEGPDREHAATIVAATAIAAQKVVYARPLANAEEAVKQAEADYEAASQDAGAAGLPAIEGEIRAREARLNALRTWSDQTAAARLIADNEAALASARQQLNAVAAVRENLSSKGSILLAARRTLTDTQAQLAAAADPASVEVSAVQSVNPTTQIIRAALSGALIGLIPAGLIVAVVMVQRASPRSEDVTATALPAAAAVETGQSVLHR